MWVRGHADIVVGKDENTVIGGEPGKDIVINSEIHGPFRIAKIYAEAVIEMIKVIILNGNGAIDGAVGSLTVEIEIDGIGVIRSEGVAIGDQGSTFALPTWIGVRPRISGNAKVDRPSPP